MMYLWNAKTREKRLFATAPDVGGWVDYPPDKAEKLGKARPAATGRDRNAVIADIEALGGEVDRRKSTERLEAELAALLGG
jgi:hypothetical protein